MRFNWLLATGDPYGGIANGLYIRYGRKLLRKYVLFPDKRVYCKIIGDDNQITEMRKTDLFNDLIIEDILKYDALHYGSVF